MRTFSKSKLLSYRQCPKRLWLEIHHPELRVDSSATQASFTVGHKVGEIAQRLYDPTGQGQVINAQVEGFSEAFSRTMELLASSQPIFEAGFKAGGALAFADVLLPVQDAGQRAWRMVEVKSSTSVKDYHRDDTAIQAFVARTAGVPLVSIALARIDSTWVYPGEGNYEGLLVEDDLTEQAFGRQSEVQTWIAEAQTIAKRTTEPEIRTGSQCGDPYECGFLTYCQGQESQPEFPVNWLPRIQASALKAHIATNGVLDMREIPDDLLNERQRSVKLHTLAGSTYFDEVGAGNELSSCKFPMHFLDFETIQFAVPIWKGTRPYQQIPFQFSLHRLSQTGKLDKKSFLDISGDDPSRAFAEALIDTCGSDGTIYVYNAGFETARIRELAKRFSKLSEDLLSINERVVDLLPIARQYYYHPSQHGSWSIKKVLPAIAPQLRYDDLEGVQDGSMAMNVFLEAIAPSTTGSRRKQIEIQLTNYCSLDTYAMFKLWQFFSGRADVGI